MHKVYLTGINFPTIRSLLYEALARLGFSDFSTLSVAYQQLTLGLALHLKSTQGQQVWES